MKHVFRVAAIPPNLAIHTYVERRLDLSRYWRMPIRHRPPRFIKFRVKDFDLAAATAQADALVGELGWRGFANFVRQTERRSSLYGGFSITHNPYKRDTHVYDSSLGDVKWNLSDVFRTPEGIRFYKWLEERQFGYRFYRIVAEHGMQEARTFARDHGFRIAEALWVDAAAPRQMPMRNSYYDTWRFSELTPVMGTGALGQLARQLRRPLIRSRCAFIRPSEMRRASEGEYLWHRDESVFVNFRLNIPLRTSPNFYLEDKELGPFEFEAGCGHSWNTEAMHRAHWRQPTEETRSALVIGTNPWFDYDPEEDAYVSNEFFGEKHPFDMLVEGDIVNIDSVSLE